MDIFTKVKTVLFNPKNGWKKFEGETPKHGEVFLKYLLPISLVAVVLVFIGNGLIDWRWASAKVMVLQGIKNSLLWFLVINGGAYLTTVLIDGIFAKVFGVEKNFDKTFATVAYSFTPFALFTILFLIPFMGWMYWMTSLYSLLLILFAQQYNLSKTEIPQGKKTGYALVSMGCLYVAFWTLYGIFYSILTAIFPNPIISALRGFWL